MMVCDLLGRTSLCALLTLAITDLANSLEHELFASLEAAFEDEDVL
jgi:hypothetical protein